MADTTLRALVQQIRSVASRTPIGESPDRELLVRFAQLRDETAFAELVGRYGGLVRNVCRNVLRHEDDAEEAMQATFLLLARRAGSLREPDALAGWLHGVAHRTALRARRDAGRRRAREACAKPGRATSPCPPPVEASWRELQELLDGELQRLPEKLRAPFVLCCLERRSKTEAARLLGWKPGTVSGRLDAARKLLRGRLARRGVSLSTVMCGLAVSNGAARASLPAALASATATAALQFARGGIAGSVGRLAGAMLRDTVAARTRTALAALCVLGALSAGLCASLLGASATQPPDTETAAAEAPPSTPPARSDQPRVDRFGDALPDGAIRRLGTKRFGHSFLTEKVVWSPDGRQIASLGGYSSARKLCLWDAATGRELREFAAQNSVMAAAFSPDGKHLAAMEQRGVVLWDVATGKEVKNFADQVNEQAVAFTPDGKTLASSGSDHVIRIRDVASGTEIAQLKGHTDRIWDMAYAPDGKTLASAALDGTVRVWDVPSAVLLWQCKKEPDAPGGVRFAPDGKGLAAVLADSSICVLDPATGKQLRSMGGGVTHGGFAVAYSPDGRTVAGAGADGCICLWDFATGREIRRWNAGVLKVRCVEFSPDGRTLASSGLWGSTVRLWDPATGRESRPAPGHNGPVVELSFSPDGKTLWSRGRDNALLRWDVATGDYRKFFGGPWDNGLEPAAFTRDGKTLATGGRVDKKVRLWNTDGTERVTLGQHDGTVAVVAFSPDGKLLASGGSEGQIRLWDVAARKELRRMDAPPDKWGNLTFSPDGRRLAAGAGNWGPQLDTAPRVFDTAIGKEVLRLTEPVGEASVIFSPDGRTLAVTGRYNDPVARRWTPPPVRRRAGAAGIPGESGAWPFRPTAGFWPRVVTSRTTLFESGKSQLARRLLASLATTVASVRWRSPRTVARSPPAPATPLSCCGT